jgi:hypothetical protein
MKKNIIKSILWSLLGVSLGFFSGAALAAGGFPITVPSAPGAGYFLVSTSTGAYIYMPFSTTTASCSGNTSCSQFTIFGSSPVTISSSGGGGGGLASSTIGWNAGYLTYVINNSTLGAVGTSTLSASSPLTGSFTQVGSGGSLGIQAASAGQNGYLSSGDYSLLHTATTTFASPLIYTNSTNQVTCPTATGSVPGCLSAADWTTFNSKGSGSVTSITAGLGLNGGAITTSGTVNLKSYIATSSAETANQIPAWTTTNGTPAQLSGGFSGYTLTSTGLTATYASTTAISTSYASSTLGYFGTLTVPSLGIAAGTFVAADPTGKLIATSSPTGTSYWTLSGNNIYNNNNGGNGFVGIGSSTPSALLSVQNNNTYTVSSTSVYRAHGTYTWTTPANALQVVVQVWGAGGGSGNYTAAGGGAGAYIASTTITGLAASYTIIVGQGGQGGTGNTSSCSGTAAGGTGYATGGNGANNGGICGPGGGGSSAFGTVVIAAGGGGGSQAGSGSVGNGATGTSGGAGGTGGGGGGGATNGGNGTTNGSGAGGTGATSATGTAGNGGGGDNNQAGGGGGSSAGVGGNGNTGATAVSSTGATGGAGSGNASGGTANTSGSNGTGANSGGGGGGGSQGINNGGNGGSPGAGGGGGSGNGSNNTTGGSGADGMIIITVYSYATTPNPIMEMFYGFLLGVKYMFQEIDSFGHLITGGPAPSCGTGCTSVTGDDRTMRVITGSTVSSATVNFANTYTTTPVCQANEESAGVVAVNASSTPSTVVLEFASALTSIRIGVTCQISNNFTY